MLRTEVSIFEKEVETPPPPPKEEGKEPTAGLREVVQLPVGEGDTGSKSQCHAYKELHDHSQDDTDGAVAPEDEVHIPEIQ